MSSEMEDSNEAMGVYELDLQRSMTGGQDEQGDWFVDVPFCLCSNPMDGLPEKVWIRFRDNPEHAKFLAEHPGMPIQITVQYTSKFR